jgi:hypothetical protein
VAHHPFLLLRRPAHSLCPGVTRVSQVPVASLHASHALWTPADPRSTHHIALSVLASDPLTPSPSACWDLRPCSLSRLSSRPGGVRPPLRATWFPVYASTALVRFCSFLLNDLPHSCNTRYGWVVNPYPLGTFTPKETPSSLGALTDQHHPPRGCGVRHSPLDKLQCAFGRRFVRAERGRVHAGLAAPAPLRGLLSERNRLAAPRQTRRSGFSSPCFS